MISKILISTLFSCSLALAQTAIYGLTITRTQTSDPTGSSCTNALEFAVYGTKWLACAGGSWQVIGGSAGGGSPVGSNGQIQYNNSGSFGGLTVSGDGTLNASTGSLTITKTNGASFAPSATIDTTIAGNISSGTLSAARLPGSISANTTGNAATATALAAAPAKCSAGTFPLGVDAQGNAVNCAAPPASTPPSGSATGDLSGSYPAPNVAKVNGTTVPLNAIPDTVLGTTSAALGSWLAVPNCQDSSGNHLNYNTTTHAFSCGTTGGSGGGTPGGTPGQIQFNNSGSFSGFTMSGDGTLNPSTGAFTVTKINGGPIPAGARLVGANAGGQVVPATLPETWAVSFCGSGTCANDAPLNRWPVRFGSTGTATCVFDAQTAPSSSVTVDMRRTSDNASILGGPVQLNGRTFPYVFTASTAAPLTVGTDSISFSLAGTSGQGITASCYAY
jgi:hypothetical protein